MLDLNRSTEQITHQLERVNKRFPESIPLDQLLGSVMDGTVQVFPVGEVSVFCCQFYGDHADIIAGAGDLKEILEALPYICDWYKEKGATYMLLRGRCGWRKILREMGWLSTDTENELRKELKGYSNGH